MYMYVSADGLLIEQINVHTKVLKCTNETWRSFVNWTSTIEFEREKKDRMHIKSDNQVVVYSDLDFERLVWASAQRKIHITRQELHLVGGWIF